MSKEVNVTERSFNPSNNPHIDEIKKRGSELADYIQDNLAPSRRRSIAITELEGALMWAVKAAARGDQ